MSKLKQVIYVPRAKMTYRISETVVDGFHIKLNDYTYDRVAKKPQGRALKHSLINNDNTERWLIYN